MRHTRSIVIAGMLVLAVMLSACAGKHIRTTAIFSEHLGQAALTAQTYVTSLHDSGSLATPDYQRWQSRFLQIGHGIKALNQALREANQEGVLVQVAAMLKLVQDLVLLEIPKLKQGERMAALIALEAVRSVLLSIAANWGTS